MKCPSCKGDMTRIRGNEWECRRVSCKERLVRWFMYKGRIVKA